METISDIALIKAVRASQIRRNKAVEAERIRKAARDKYVRYFSKLFFKDDDDELATRKLRSTANEQHLFQAEKRQD